MARCCFLGRNTASALSVPGDTRNPFCCCLPQVSSGRSGRCWRYTASILLLSPPRIVPAASCLEIILTFVELTLNRVRQGRAGLPLTAASHTPPSSDTRKFLWEVWIKVSPSPGVVSIRVVPFSSTVKYTPPRLLVSHEDVQRQAPAANEPRVPRTRHVASGRPVPGIVLVCRSAEAPVHARAWRNGQQALNTLPASRLSKTFTRF